jgi:hypothetical protein
MLVDDKLNSVFWHLEFELLSFLILGICIFPLRSLRLCLPREMCNQFNWGGEK